MSHQPRRARPASFPSRFALAFLPLMLVYVGAPPSADGQAGRARVLVTTFQTAEPVDHDFGREIAEKLRERVNGFDLLVSIPEDEVEDALGRFDLEDTRMDLVSWRQLASRLDAQLLIFGEVAPASGSERLAVTGVIRDEGSGGGEVVSTEVVVSESGGDQADSVAVHFAERLDEAVQLLMASLNCQDYLEAKQYRDALRNCDRALAIAPDHARALKLKAQILVESREWEAALDPLEKLLEVQSDSYDGLRLMVEAHDQLGHEAKVITYLRRFVEEYTSSVAARLTLARRLVASDSVEAAREVVEAGLPDPELKSYLESIDSRQAGPVEPATPASENPSGHGFEVLDWYAEHDESGHLWIKGQVRNTGRTGAGVQLLAVAYNAAGRVVDSSTFWPASLNNIPPGQTWPINHPLTDDARAQRAELRVVGRRQWER